MRNKKTGFRSDDADWRALIKKEAWEKIEKSTLMKSCATGGKKEIRALMAGFWNFVHRFPGIINGTFTVMPSHKISEKLGKFLKRSAPTLSGTLKEMENDERNHRFLWLNASSVVGLDLDALNQWQVLEEIDKISMSISQADVKEKLLAFVAVEIVAEGISQYLCRSPYFRESMGSKGLGWFNVHTVHPDDGTTHEDIAYRVVLQIYQADGTNVSGKMINGTVQKYVDMFIVAAGACHNTFVTEASVS